MNDAYPHDNPWRSEEGRKQIACLSEARSEAMKIWDDLPEKNKAWFETYFVLSYENILSIDEEGDEYLTKPHLYVPNEIGVIGWFKDYKMLHLECGGRWSQRTATPYQSTRVVVFPKDKDMSDDDRDFYAREVDTVS